MGMLDKGIIHIPGRSVKYSIILLREAHSFKVYELFIARTFHLIFPDTLESETAEKRGLLYSMLLELL